MKTIKVTLIRKDKKTGEDVMTVIDAGDGAVAVFDGRLCSLTLSGPNVNRTYAEVCGMYAENHESGEP